MTDSRLAEHGGALRLTPRNGGILPAILKVVRRVASFDFLGVEFCVDGMNVISSGRADSGWERTWMQFPPTRCRGRGWPFYSSSFRIADSREPWRIMYPLAEVLLLLTCATIAGCDDFDDIVAVGRVSPGFSAPVLAVSS